MGKLDQQTARRILAFLHSRVATLDDPRSIGEALKGSKLGEFWKYRIGNYRVIARIEDAALRVEASGGSGAFFLSHIVFVLCNVTKWVAVRWQKRKRGWSNRGYPGLRAGSGFWATKEVMTAIVTPYYSTS